MNIPEVSQQELREAYAYLFENPIGTHFARETSSVPFLTHWAERLTNLKRRLTNQELMLLCEIAKNRYTPPDVLRKLVDWARSCHLWQKTWYVIYHISWNPSAPPELLKELASSKVVSVRQGVANNRNTPPEVLEKLSRDRSKWVRWAVAGNPRTPASALWHLINSEVFEIRKAVVTNPSAPLELLQAFVWGKLCGSDIRLISTAMENTVFPVEEIEKIARTAVLPIKKIYNHPLFADCPYYWRTDGLIAGALKCSRLPGEVLSEILEQLLMSPPDDYMLRYLFICACLGHPAVPEELVMAAFFHHSEEVRKKAQEVLALRRMA